ncbi:MAG: hypothetical protein JWQ96_1273 [Segetibacter sp.]|nr:hypothetical protein [Segetibacter sp.]
MNIPLVRDRIKKTGFYIPFTLYFLAFVVAAFLAWQSLHRNQLQPDTAYADIFNILLKVAFWFAVIIISIALVSVAVSFAFFLFARRKNKITFKIETDLKESELHQKQTVRLFIHPVLKPLFGFIKLRLLYDKNNFSQKFSLLEQSQRKFFSTTIQGTYHWPLPAIKEYHVEKAILYFEDVFQFFSIAVDMPASSHFFTHPTAIDTKDLNVKPRKTEDTSTRIEELRKVEGEFLNYKNFENNDDVRRIVWKIYAKNKELVVRIPEIIDPYASHVYLYASYFSNFNIDGNGAVEVPFLNYFKVYNWTIYQKLVKQGFEVRYIADQDLAKASMANEEQLVKYSIATSRWHTDKDLRTYVKPSDASIVVISSLSDATQVQELAERFADITFMFIKLSDSLKKQNVIDWVQWLFVQEGKNDLDMYKRQWAMSPLRTKILQNEKQLASILEKYQKPVLA